MRHRRLLIAFAAPLVTCAAACLDRSDADFRAEVAASMHSSMTQDLADMVQAARDLQAASPTRAWIAGDPSIARMRDAWKRLRFAWEQVEGAIAPMFAGLNVTMDARYEDFLPGLGGAGDQAPFDATGVIGMHAIERILYAPDTRPEVVAYESSLPGYKQAAYPATDNEAIAFKTQLVQRLIDDASLLASSWKPEDVDIAAAYQGMVDLMNEQQDKVKLAATGAEESRYSNITLADLRNNLTGTHQAYDLFREWIYSKSSASTSDQQVQDQFSSLKNAYAVTPGESLPAAPPGWNPSNTTLDSDFGKLWQQVHDSVDPDSQGSVVFEMNRIADLLGLTAATGITEPPTVHLRRMR